MIDALKQRPDFYISSSEYDTWRDVREGYVLGHLRGPRPTGYWWVEVRPSGPGTGPVGEASEAVLAERHKGCDLSTLGDEPMAVYVCRILDHTAVEQGTIEADDIELVTWAEVARLPSLLPSYGP